MQDITICESGTAKGVKDAQMRLRTGKAKNRQCAIDQRKLTVLIAARYGSEYVAQTHNAQPSRKRRTRRGKRSTAGNAHQSVRLIRHTDNGVFERYTGK